VSDKTFSNSLRNRANAIIVSDNSLLLLKLNLPTREYPVWMPPGGGVNFGETLEDALVREVKEETGLVVQPLKLLWIHEFLEKPYHALEFYFECSISGGMLKLGSDPEISENDQILLDLKFISADEAKELPVYPEFLREFISDGSEIILPDQIKYVKNESQHSQE